jgi:3-oxoacyl-[acyl-carrier-protein] synthase-3
MTLPAVWLGAPAVRLPSRARFNADVLGLVREQFRGSDEEWGRVERRIRSLFRACGTDRRFIEADPPPGGLADQAALPVQQALAAAGVSAADLDLVLYGSIARQYYEPSTAAEVAGLVGAHRAMPIDVTSACAGALLAVQDFVARAAVDDAVRTGVVCTATMTRAHIQYAIQTPEEVALLGAGLTLGNAATAMVLARTPLPGSGRVRAMLAEGLPAHHGLCRAPVGGHFISDGPALFALAQHLPGHVRRVCDRAGWRVDEVDWFCSHQPSNSVLRAAAGVLEIDAERIPGLHGLYGNCAESSVPLTLNHLLADGRIRPGMKLVLATAASGFVMASVAVEWEG